MYFLRKRLWNSVRSVSLMKIGSFFSGLRAWLRNTTSSSQRRFTLNEPAAGPATDAGGCTRGFPCRICSVLSAAAASSDSAAMRIASSARSFLMRSSSRMSSSVSSSSSLSSSSSSTAAPPYCSFAGTEGANSKSASSSSFSNWAPIPLPPPPWERAVTPRAEDAGCSSASRGSSSAPPSAEASSAEKSRSCSAGGRGCSGLPSRAVFSRSSNCRFSSEADCGPEPGCRCFTVRCLGRSLDEKAVRGARKRLPDCESPPCAGFHVGRWAVDMAQP
mmetsp:Transcript_1186/g.3131  ORF Transcript_1186/g.3131 Transcript_1186/m.3131 type:complete len:275 (-) Transcript_1186:9-833(-)